MERMIKHWNGLPKCSEHSDKKKPSYLEVVTMVETNNGLQLYMFLLGIFCMVKHHPTNLNNEYNKETAQTQFEYHSKVMAFKILKGQLLDPELNLIGCK